jgi:hypothetical protein
MKLFQLKNLVAICIWCFGLWTTILFLEQIGVSNANYTSLFVGFAVQLALTFAQHNLWTQTNNKALYGMSAVFFGFDTFLNHGGFYPYLINITNTSAYSNLGLPDNPPMFLVGIVSLMICAMIAALPEIIIASE